MCSIWRAQLLTNTLKKNAQLNLVCLQYLQYSQDQKKKSGFLGKQSRCTFFWLIDTSEEYAKKSVDNKSATVSIILVMIMKLQTRDCLTGLSLVLSCL